MKVGDFTTNYKDYNDFTSYIHGYYMNYLTTGTAEAYNRLVRMVINERITYLFDIYKHNYFYDFVVDIKQEEVPNLNVLYQNNIMCKYYEKYGKSLKVLQSEYNVRHYSELLNEYSVLKSSLERNYTKKILASETVTTNELSGSNENLATTSNTLNTEKINQGTPVNTDIYGVGNTLSAEKGKNTNNENTTTTQSNSENATSTTTTSFNINYFLTLDTYDALIELDKKLREYTTVIVDKYFYKPFKEIFINAIDFERIERIRGV